MSKSKTNYNKIREHLSNLEHEQWMSWSKTIAEKLSMIKHECEEGNKQDAIIRINRIISEWKTNWKPYKELKEWIKEYDREWADKILDSIPIKCPVYQCGGLMVVKERKLPKNFIEGEHYDGDDQTPDLVCTNCKAIYQFKGFKNG